jgi:hypothetical protein
MMHLPCLNLKTVSCVLGLVFALSPPASAQDWTQPWADPQDRPPRVDISASFGFMTPTDWSDLVLLGTLSSASGVLEQVLVRDLRVEPHTDFGGALTYWRGRYGVRAQAGLSRSSLVIGGPPFDEFPTDEESLRIDIDTWSYDVRGAIGFLEYEPRRLVWPYAFFGLGGITYDLERTIRPPLLTFIEHPPAGPAPQRIFDDSREFLLAVDEIGLETVFAFSLGLGTDFRIPLGPAGIGVRLEVSDQIAPSPVGLRIGELRRTQPLNTDTGVQFGLVHHLRASAGFVLQIGR